MHRAHTSCSHIFLDQQVFKEPLVAKSYIMRRLCIDCYLITISPLTIAGKQKQNKIKKADYRALMVKKIEDYAPIYKCIHMQSFIMY